MDEVVVFWTEVAEKQRDQIFEYWNNHNQSTEYSERLNRILQQKINHLKVHPKSGGKFRNSKARVIHFEHYSLIYNVFGNHIFIYSLWDNNQDPKKIMKLLQRFKR